MSTWILLLRGINVGGRNALPMGDLVRLLESFDLEDVATYIQSGNVVFQAAGPVLPTLASDIAEAIEERHGFKPRVLLFGADRLEDAIESNPFPEAEAEPGSLHVYFLESQPETPDLESLDEAGKDSERYHLGERAFYLHAPEGIGRSRLAANVERYLGVAATARNWRTVAKLREMATAR